MEAGFVSIGDVTFRDLEDEAIVELVRKGNTDALEYLIHKYKNFVRAKSRSLLFSGCRSRRHCSRRYDRVV